MPLEEKLHQPLSQKETIGTLHSIATQRRCKFYVLTTYYSSSASTMCLLKTAKRGGPPARCCSLENKVNMNYIANPSQKSLPIVVHKLICFFSFSPLRQTDGGNRFARQRCPEPSQIQDQSLFSSTCLDLARYMYCICITFLCTQHRVVLMYICMEHSVVVL
jgi:hypothetical protein